MLYTSAARRHERMVPAASGVWGYGTSKGHRQAGIQHTACSGFELTANVQHAHEARVARELGQQRQGEPDNAVVVARDSQDAQAGCRREVLDCGWPVKEAAGPW